MTAKLSNPKARLCALLITAASLVATTAARSADKPAVVDAKISWKVGETRTYERVKGRTKLQKGKVASKGAGRSRLELKVLEASEKGYLLQWSLSGTKTDDPIAAKDPFAVQFSRLIDSLKIKIELDENASIIGVRNWKELKATSEKMISTMTDPKLVKGMDRATAEKLRVAVGSMFSTKERIEQAFTHEPRIFLAAIGRSYDQAQPVEYDQELPSPLNGAPIPCRGRIALESYDAKTGRAKVSMTQTVDPEVARRVILKSLKEMGEKLGRKDAPDAKSLGAFSVDDRGEFVIDVKTGWLEEANQSRTVTSGDSTQEDTLTFKRLKSR
ncbi:hypothetical protein [Singulisphaera sp. PoT]|uniref:hypothetical protein n=1 Tax=Singulisphaera sp. PoT TaxID=3411797 RepID=UPI003BF5C7BA